MKKTILLIAILLGAFSYGQVPDYHFEGAVFSDLTGTASDPVIVTQTNDAFIYWNTTLGKFRKWDGTVFSDLGITDLQTSYNASTSLEITTNATLGAFTLKRGSALDTDNVYEGQNGVGTTTYSVNGNGKITANEISLSGNLATNGNIDFGSFDKKILGLGNVNHFIQPITTGSHMNFASVGDYTINIDSDNTSTTNFFGVFKDATDESGGLLFKVQEDGESIFQSTTPILSLEQIGGGPNENNYSLFVGPDTFNIRLLNDAKSSFTTPFQIQRSGTNADAIDLTATTISLNGAVEISGLFTSTGIDDNATSTAITIDGSNNTGFGTNTPGAAVEITGSGGGTIDTRLIVGGFGNGGTNRGTAIDIQVPGASSQENGARLSVFTTGGAVTSQSADLAFSTASSGILSESMRIKANGNVGVGTTLPTALFSVNGTANNPTASWGTFSDERVKNITGKFTDGLNVINNLNPINFNYMENSPFTYKEPQVGISAQELELLAPYMVFAKDYEGEITEDGEVIKAPIKDLRQVNNQAYIFLLINSVKEQQVMIQDLQKRILTLENK